MARRALKKNSFFLLPLLATDLLHLPGKPAGVVLESGLLL
jgi:hypothetical protein